MTKKIITQSRLKELLEYDSETGIFIRKVTTCSRAKTGDIAGGLTSYGYTRIMIDSKFYQCHRLAFLYMTGKFPKDQTDHINHVKDDNRWENLREADYAMNTRNASRRSDNKSGHTGVHLDKASNKWEAQIQIKGKSKYLGQFIKKADAIAARVAANIKYGYHPNHGKILRPI